MATFAAQIDKWVKKAGISLKNAVKAIRVQIIGGVLYRTPVLDSSLVQSWIATTGEPSPNIVDVPSGSVANPEQKKQDAIKEAMKISEEKIDGVFWLTNNQPYVRRIEYEGYSRKAPEGMVRITMLELKSGLERLLNNV